MLFVKCLIRELEAIVSLGTPLYVGVTDDPIRREQQHRRKFSATCTMYYAPTSNMQYAENRLLQICKERGVCRINIQRISNAPQADGCVYAIFG